MPGISQKIAMAGSTGNIGTALAGHMKEVEWVPLTREDIWGATDELAGCLEGTTAVVNLAGASIARIWTKKNRQRIIASREGVNERLVKAVLKMEPPPEMFITASAIGYYSNDGIHTENNHMAGEGFLTEVIRKWEAPLEALPEGTTAVKARIANVLSSKGGMLAPFLLGSYTGMIPVMGSGKQPVSFIHIEDVVRGLAHILRGKRDGVYNLVSPYPADFATFARTLVQHTMAFTTLRIPRSLVKLLMGEAHVLVTEGQHVVPERLTEEKFEFSYPHLEEALENLLKKH